jgi:hypothetical protein
MMCRLLQVLVLVLVLVLVPVCSDGVQPLLASSARLPP